nr:retrovirus-related Pol polyprotein from transposon TNT 1-94 [Tanacetum cinerariifolium]
MVEKSKLDKDKEGKAIDPSHYRGSAYRKARTCDADHAGCQDTRRSTSGSVQFLGERLISWSSKRYHFIKEHVKNGVIELYFVNTEYQLADLFTKALGRDKIEFLTYKLGMRSFTPETLKKLMNEEDETMATTIEQQVTLDEALVPSSKRKNIVDLESFREMLHISPRIPGQSFAELPFEEEILEFLRFLGHSAQIKTLTDVNVNKLYQPWRSFAAVINKCLTRKSTGFDSLRHQNTQQYGAILPIELTTEDIRNTKAYKEYYACATGEAALNPKASARKKRGGSASSTTPPTPIATPTPTTTVVAAPRLSTAAKGKQPARATSHTDPSDVKWTEAEQLKIVIRRRRHEMHISQQGGFGTNKGTGSKLGVLDVPSDDSEEEISWNSSDDEDVDEQTKGRDESEGEKTNESNDEDDDQEEAKKVNDDDDDEEEIPKINEQETTESGEGADEETESDGESEEEETTKKEEESFDPILRTPEESEDDGNGMESIFTTGSSIVTPIPSPKSTMTPSIMTTTTTASQPPIPPTPIPSIDLQILPTFASVFCFDDRVKSLEDNLSEFRRTNQSPESVSNIPGIVHQYIHQETMKAIREAVQTQTDWLQDSIKRENDEFLRTIDDNMKKIIKEQVKNEQRNLYKALVKAYDVDKTILDSYGESAIMKRRREDDDDQEGPSAGSDQGPKRRREGGEHASASTPSEPTTESACRSTTGSQSRQLSASESAFVEEPVQTTCQMEEPSHPMFETAAQGNDQSWISALAKQTDARSSFNKLQDTPIDFSNFIVNRLGVDTLTPELLAGPTYELMRGSCNSLTELEYHLEEVYKATMNQLDWVNPEGQQYPHNLLQPLPLIPDNRGRRFYGFAVNRESTLNVYSKRRIIVVTDLKIVKWHNYKHLDWISPDTYRSDLKQREAYTAYSNPRGFIYQNRDKKNRLMRIDELHKFSDRTLNYVCNALDDRLKGIRMQYLPTTIWRKWDKDRAAAMIQAIDKMLKTRRIMRSLE